MNGDEPQVDRTVRWLPLPRFVHRLTIAQRVRIWFAIGAAVVVIISLIASVLIRRVTDTLSGVVEQVRQQQVTAMTMKDAVSAENTSVEGYLIQADPSFLDQLASAHAQFLAAAAQLGGPGVDGESRTVMAQIVALEDEFRRSAQQEIDLSREGSTQAASLYWQTEGQRAEQALRARLDDVVARSESRLNGELTVARRNEAETRNVFAPVVALTAIFGLLTALLASSSITRRFERLEHTVERIEQGDFHVELQETGHDELGKLARSIQNMARALEMETREREQLLAERARANARISALYDVARTVNQSLDTEEVLRLALNKLLAHTQMTAAVALLQDDSTERFRVAMVDGIGDEAAAEVAGFFEEDDAQRFAADAMASDGVTRLDLGSLTFDSGPFRAAVAVPLRARDTSCGVLILATEQDVPVSDEEGRLIEGLAKQIGTALEHASLYAQSSRLAAAEERNRLARELHDSVTQSLFSISMMSQALPSLIERAPDRAVERAVRLSELARGALAEMRMLILELRPTALQEMGLATALERHVTGFGSREALEISFCVEGLQRRLPQTYEEALFRITQEALNNVARHAQAKRVTIVLEFAPATVHVSIRDDGVGLAGGAGGGFGLTSMRERAEQLGGTLSVVSEPNQGTTVSAIIPAPAPSTSIAG